MDKTFYFALPLNDEAYRANYRLENYLLDIDHPNSETVDINCAIIVFPSDKQLQHYREIQKDDFDETVQSNKEYYDMVKDWIETAGVKTISIRGEYLKLIGEIKTWNLTLRKDYLPPWNLIFFNREGEPKIIPPAELNTELIISYFNTRQS